MRRRSKRPHGRREAHSAAEADAAAAEASALEQVSPDGHEITAESSAAPGARREAGARAAEAAVRTPRQRRSKPRRRRVGATRGVCHG